MGTTFHFGAILTPPVSTLTPQVGVELGGLNLTLEFRPMGKTLCIERYFEVVGFSIVSTPDPLTPLIPQTLKIGDPQNSSLKYSQAVAGGTTL